MTALFSKRVGNFPSVWCPVGDLSEKFLIGELSLEYLLMYRLLAIAGNTAISYFLQQ